MSDHLQKVVDLENARLNEINEQKALARLREISVLTKQRDALNERIAQYQKELAEMQWDTVTVDTVLGSTATETQPQ